AWTVGTANLQGSDDTLALAPVTDTYAQGGKGRYLAAGGAAAFRRGFRPIDTYTPVANGEDYFMSFLVNPGGSFQTSVNFGYATIGFTNFFDSQAFANVPGSANVFGLQVGYRGDSTGDDDGFDLIVRARDSSGDLADFDLAPGVANATSLVVLKVTPTAAEDEVTFWVNPTDPSSEAGLTSTAASTGSFDTFALNTPGDMDRLNVLTNGWGRNFFYDEPRLAYDLDSLFNIESQLPGDANGDGTVDLADFGILRANFGTSMSTFEMGDFNGDGNVDLADFGILRANFGATSGSDIAALDAWYVTVVPEPTTLALAGLGGLALLRRRR
ncbi:MAG: dockerin type I domain-containing protein, partial [Planctomycetota bacterium]